MKINKGLILKVDHWLRESIYGLVLIFKYVPPLRFLSWWNRKTRFLNRLRKNKIWR